MNRNKQACRTSVVNVMYSVDLRRACDPEKLKSLRKALARLPDVPSMTFMEWQEVGLLSQGHAEGQLIFTGHDLMLNDDANVNDVRRKLEGVWSVLCCYCLGTGILPVIQIESIEHAHTRTSAHAEPEAREALKQILRLTAALENAQGS